ncbi:hypothetical protein ACVNP1_05230 [Staphylococcus aureus]
MRTVRKTIARLKTVAREDKLNKVRLINN